MALDTTISLPDGAPEEVITHSFLREVDLRPFGFEGTLALITLDNLSLIHISEPTRPY